jgi:hypothetical protein
VAAAQSYLVGEEAVDFEPVFKQLILHHHTLLLWVQAEPVLLPLKHLMV